MYNTEVRLFCALRWHRAISEVEPPRLHQLSQLGQPPPRAVQVRDPARAPQTLRDNCCGGEGGTIKRGIVYRLTPERGLASEDEIDPGHQNAHVNLAAADPHMPLVRVDRAHRERVKMTAWKPGLWGLRPRD